MTFPVSMRTCFQRKAVFPILVLLIGIGWAFFLWARFETWYVARDSSPYVVSASAPLMVGDFRQDLVVKHSVDFINKGPKNLRVISAIPSCGCANVRLGKLDLLPGERTKLTFEVNFGRKGGARQVSCRLKGSNNESYIVQLSANALPTLQLDDKVDFATFGVLAPNDRSARTSLHFIINGNNDGQLPVLELTKIGTEEVQGHLSAVPINFCPNSLVSFGVASQAFGNRQGYRLDLILSPLNRSIGFHHSTLGMSLTGSNGAISHEIPVEWTIRSAFEIEPEQLVIEDASHKSSSIPRVVIVRLRNGEHFRIIKAYADDETVQVTATPADSENKEWIMHVVAPEFDRNKSEIWHIYGDTDQLVEPKISIPLVHFVSKK